jgi:glycosyltransferase involved in cell wall biosynthesis
MISHICIFPDRIDDGGVDRYAINLAQAFIDEGMKVDIFVTNGVGRLLSQKPAQAGLFIGGGTAKSSFWPFFRYLIQHKPDVVISANLYIDVICIVARIASFSKAKNLVSLHSTFSKDAYRGRPWLKAIYSGICRLLYPKAHFIVAVSKAVAEDAKTYFRLAQDVSVIYNPVITKELRALSLAPIRHPFYQKHGEFVILSVGRLTVQKDFETLLQAFATLTQKLRCKLVILGEGEELQNLQRLTHELNIFTHVDFVGFVDNPYPFFLHSDVLVSSSQCEGLPTVIIEALAVGTKVVATDCPGGSSEILGGGQFGALVPIQDSLALSNAIYEALLALKSPKVEDLLKERAKSFTAFESAKAYLRLMNS